MPRPRFSFRDDPPPVPPRPCDHPGCVGSGEFRAPRSRATLDEFYWFCLNHVREYNASWNYYAGMSSAEIEQHVRHDTVWQRPTWPLSGRIGTLRGAKWRGFGLFDMDEEAPAKKAPKQPRSIQEKALALFDLVPPLTLAGLKMRYKELVKLHHPDVHGGDKEAEEKLKEINLAYSTLKASYFPS
jgi:hypothetical protein